MIQNPNIKFLDRDTISLKDTSPNSHFFLTENQPQKFEVQPKQDSLWKSQKIDHNLGYRCPIWVIQKPNIKFLDRAKISLKDTSPNSSFFYLKISLKNWTTYRVKIGHYSHNPLFCQIAP